MYARTAMIVSWTAFLAACVLEFVVFAAVDPSRLLLAGVLAGLSRMTVYTIAFFVFWAGCALCGALTMLLASAFTHE